MVMILALPLAAWAAPKVAVTPIDGDTESEVRDVLIEAVDGGDFKLISKKETNRAVDKIDDMSELTEKNGKKLAKDLSADAIVSGSLQKKGATKTLKIRLFVNGKMKKGFSVKFKGSVTGAKFKKKLRETLVDRLDGTTEMAAAEEPKKPKKVAEVDDEDPNPKKPKKGEKAEKAAKTETNGKAEKAEKAETAEKAEAAEDPEAGEKSDDEKDDDEQAAKDPPADDEEAAKPAPKKTAAALKDDEGDDPTITKRATPRASGGRSANRASARIDVGPSVVKRSLIFNSNLPSDQAPKPFRPSPVLGTRVGGELYPFGFVNPNSLLAGIGFGFKYDRTLILNVGTSAEPGVEVPTKQFNYAAGVRIRLVGKSATSPSVTVSADLGRSRFQPDRGKLMDPNSLDLPDTYYKFVAPGLGFRIPLGRLLAFSASGQALLVQDAGAIVRSYSYGRALVLGFDAEAGVDIVLAKRFAVRLSGGLTQIAYDFQGAGGERANNRDLDPSTLDVGGAADRSISGAVTVGVMY
jgi:hypothetical protein